MAGLNSGRYDALEPRAPSPFHDPSLQQPPHSVEHLPMEDLDFDIPPQGGLPQGARHPFYSHQFGGPEMRHSFADSAASSMHHHSASENPSYAALPVEHGSVYESSSLSQPFHPYRDYPSQPNLASSRGYSPTMLHEKRNMYDRAGKSRRKTWLILGAVALVVIAAGAGLGVYFGIVRPNQNKKVSKADSNASSDHSDGNSTSSTGKTPVANLIVSGGDGTKITAEDGTTFTYSNSFGGTWYFDPNNPYANHAQAQSYTPPLNTSWNYGVDKIYGVNLGGWLNTEPFISPALYEKYSSNPVPPIDEWTLSQAMRADTAGGGISQLETHYKTFITEQDFAAIAGAGLNWLRIPIPYWAIEVRDDEPFLEGVCWKYFLKAIEWARKYGLRINLDFHALPGSQNGWNHSGRLGTINMLNGVMGIANAQRSLTYIRIFAEFISQPQYKDVIPFFGIANEPQASVVGVPALQAFYLQAYQIVRGVSGIGEGNGPFVIYHDGFNGLNNWVGFLPNGDRVGMDTHPYFAFGGQSTAAISSFGPAACTTWGPMMNDSWTNIGVTAAGEFSLATNDCGLFVNGVGLGTRYEGTFAGGPDTAVGSCDQWDDWTSYSADTKAQLKTFAASSMDALQNWFFWTWKIGNSTQFNMVRAPFWSYQLGLEQGWIPPNPRSSAGKCSASDPFVGPVQPWQTGGVGAGQIPPSATTALVWPPAVISNAGPAPLLPTYTETGTVPTLSVSTVTASGATTTVSPGNGWFNAADTELAYVSVAGCSYPDPWSGVGAPVPTAPCTGAGVRKMRREPVLAVVTPMPS